MYKKLLNDKYFVTLPIHKPVSVSSCIPIYIEDVWIKVELKLNSPQSKL